MIVGTCAISNGMEDEIKIEEILINTVTDLMKKIEFDANVEVLKNDISGSILYVVSIKSENDLGSLIGKNGQNIKALEHLARLLAYKKIPAGTNFILDVNDYRKSRASYVLENARIAVERVKGTGRAEALLPMSSYERRLVHMELASHSDVITESIGEEPNRRVVIKPLI